MENWFQILLPIATLLLGYFLNIWVGSIDSKREVERRRIMEREKAYQEILEKLFELLDAYKWYIVRARLQIENPSSDNSSDFSIPYEKSRELDRLIIKKSLYLKPSVFEALRSFHVMGASDSIEGVDFMQEKLEEMGEMATDLMNDIRKELGLEVYLENELEL